MSDKNVAYRYAKPIVDLANEKGVLDQVYADMQLLKDTCEENSQFMAVLRNPVIRGFKKYAILKALFADKINALTLQLFELMGRKDREDMLYELSLVFIEIYNAQKGIQKVTVISASPLENEQKADLQAKLAQQLKKIIQITEKVDASLLGGFIIQVGDNQIIDNSVRSQLKRLKLKFADTIK